MLVGALGLAAPAMAQTDEDANLDQAIRSEQPVARGEKTLADGHVDVGPRFVDGRWTLMVHDDAAKAEDGSASVWRHPERTVLRVTDDALLDVPDDETYGFLPAKPGDRVHVVPQTQNPDVVWVGWNTQDPEVMERIDRGVTMTLTGVQGPGDLVVYLQSGDFGDPQVLWDSTAQPKPAWVDVNTHTHANWVFSRPGVYLVRVRIAAELIDGTSVSDTRDLRFAVGASAKPADALAARWAGPDPQVDEDAQATAASGDVGAEEDGGGSGGMVVAIVAVALALGAVLAATVVRARRVRARARTEDDA
ncbi:MAG: choice-of-anchor M domain-containing protein [Patulibacter sp.]|nr:choice-of-anchor M domain-containing protein [Patulibacter sp.]